MKTLLLVAMISSSVWSMTPPPWPREVSGQVCGHTREDLLSKLRAKDRETIEIAYFDTKELELQARTLIVRLRVFEDKGEVTVKLRADAPPTQTEGAECEVDVGRDRALSSCAWKQDISRSDAEKIMKGSRDIREAMSDEQKQVIGSVARDVTHAWKRFGPVSAERFKIQEGKDSKRWRLERWSLSDGVVLLAEVSFQEKRTLPPTELSRVLDAYLRDRRVIRCEQDEPKTNLVLRHFRGLVH